MHDKRVANLLGAASLAVSDRMLHALTDRTALSPSAVAATVVLHELGPMGVSRLGHCVGLTQPAASRVADVLERQGLIRRAESHGRERFLELTPEGTVAAQMVLDERARLLDGLLATLSADETALLDRVLGTLLTELYGFVPNSSLLCRYCDRGACTDTAVCPVGQAERDRRQSAP